MKTKYSNFAKRVVIALAVVLMAGNVWGSETIGPNEITISAGWTNKSGAAYCGGYGKNAGWYVSDYNITALKNVLSDAANSNFELTIEVQGICNTGNSSSVNSLSVVLLNKDGNTVGTAQTYTNLISGTNAPGANNGWKTFNFTPTSAVTGYKIYGGAYCAVYKTKYTLTYDAAPAVQHTVTWQVNGSTVTTTNVDEGSKPTFPNNPSSCDLTSTTFIGWTQTTWSGKKSKSYIDGLTTDATKVYTIASQMPDVSGDVTYHAVFAKGGAANTYVKGSASDLTDGQKVLIVNTANNVAIKGASEKKDALGVSISSNTITTTNTNVLWTVRPQQSGYYFKYGDNFLNGYYTTLYIDNSNSEDAWTLTGSGPYVLNSANATSGYKLKYNGSNAFTLGNGSGDAYEMDFYIPITPSQYLTTCIPCEVNPTVTAASNNGAISSTSVPVQCASGISNIGGEGCGITSYGFCWAPSATTTTPTTSNSTYEVGTDYESTGTAFNYTITGLTPNTSYTIRPYATNGNGTAYGTAYTVTTLQRYDITYNNNGGTGSIDAATKDYGANFTLPANAGTMTKTGYHIADWKLNSASGASFALGGTYSGNAAAEFYAGWVPNTFSVAFNKNGGQGDQMTSQEFTYDVAQNLNANTYTPEEGSHKYFAGWAISTAHATAGTVDYADKASVSNLIASGTYTLYAVWKAYTYTNYRTKCCTPLDAPTNIEACGTGLETATVTWNAVDEATGYEYSLDGTTWTTASVTGTTTKTLTLTGLTASTEYTIYVRANGEGNNCAEGTASTGTDFKTYSTVTAESNENSYGTAKVSLTDGSGWASSVNAADGTTIYLKATANSGYTFSSWAAGSGSVTAQTASTTLSGWSGNTTVTATFAAASLPTLPTPTGMASSSITATSAVISWTADANANGYTVTCAGATVGAVTINDGVASCPLTSLTAGTEYTWTVLANGDNTNYKSSEACGDQNFTTVAKQPATVTISTAPSKIVYNSGDHFDATDMVVRVEYNNGDVDENYTDYTLSPTTEAVLTPSNTYVTVTATLNEGSASVNQAITVNAKLTWKAAGAEDVITYASSGKAVLPNSEPTAPVCLGDFNTFQGWSASAIAVSTTTEPSYVSAETDAMTDKTYYAVFAKMGDGDEEDAYSELTVNAPKPTFPYATSDGATWTQNEATFNGGTNGVNSGLTTSGSWIQVVLPTSATEAVSYVVTSTSNSWANATNAALTSGSTGITTIAKIGLSYNFTNDNKSLGTYRLSYGSGNAWIAKIRINYKKIGQVPVEWATTCCTPWEAPAISYSVPSGWKYGDDALSVSIAEGTTYGSVSYESSNTAVLTVATDGAITAVAPGTATITATWAGATVLGTKYCEASSTSADIDVSGTITVTFNGNGADGGSMDAQVITYKSATALTSNAFTKTGYSFGGWAASAEAAAAKTVLYTNGQSVTLTEGCTLFAIWNINSHNVTLTQPTVSEVAAGTIKANNSTTSPASVNYGVEVTLTATENKTNMDGYVFESWTVTGVTLADATANPAQFTMPNNAVSVSATYHAYTWDLEETPYTITSDAPQTTYEEYQTFDKDAITLQAHYKRSDNNEQRDDNLSVNDWKAYLGEDEISDNYVFQLADKDKTLYIKVGSTEVAHYTMTINPIPKDHFVVNIWTVDAISDQMYTYTMPSLSAQTADNTEAGIAACKDHNYFMGWVEEGAEPTASNIVAGGTTGRTASNKTYVAVWAKKVDTNYPAGYRLVSTAPTSGSSVVLAAKYNSKYYAYTNEKGIEELTVTSNVISSSTTGITWDYTTVGSYKYLQVPESSPAKYIHFNSTSLSVAQNVTNGDVYFTSIGGTNTFKVSGNTSNLRYMTFNGESFGVDASESSAEPIYIFMNMAASVVSTYEDYITDCVTRHTISFNSNGASGEYDSKQLQEGTVVDLPDGSALYKQYHSFTGWKSTLDDHIYDSEHPYTVSTANDELVAQWQEFTKAVVKYQGDNIQNSTTDPIYATQNYTLRTTPTILANYDQTAVFIGWQKSDDLSGTLYKAGATNMVMPDPAEEITYIARFIDQLQVPANYAFSGGEWILVTNEDQLQAGDFVVITSSNHDKAIGKTQQNNNRAEANVSKSQDKSTITLSDDVAILFLQKSYEEGEFALYDVNAPGFLYAPGMNTNYYLRTQTSFNKYNSWRITIDANNVASIIAQGEDTNNDLRYNSTHNFFSAYGSNNLQTTVQIYKYSVGTEITITEAVNASTDLVNNVDLIVKTEGKITMDEERTVNDFIIEAMEGVSGQVLNPENLSINGNAYYDLTLNTSGTMDNSKWYAFAVPFPVDAATGIQRLSNEGVASNAVFNGHYILLKYNSSLRASSGDGWEYVTAGETLEPGKFYMVALNSNMYNRLRMTKKAGAQLNNKGDLLLKLQAAADPKNANWNALANNALAYANVSATGSNAALKVQVYNSATNNYTPYDYTEVTLTVGTPFFVQVGGNGTMSVVTGESNHGELRAPKHYEVTTEEFQLRLGADTESYFDRLYVSASEDALNEYQIGHDLAKAGVSSIVPQMYVAAYGAKLCDAEFPLVNNEATFPLTLTTPTTGTYQLYVARAAQDADLYLLHNDNIIWNLTMSPYEITLPQGTTTDYSLLLKAKMPQTPTGIENAEVLNGANGVQKIIVDDHVFILRGGKMYDATGKMVR